MFYLLLQIFHLFLSVTGETELFLEAPQNGGTCFDSCLAQHVMKDHHLGGMKLRNHNFSIKQFFDDTYSTVERQNLNVLGFWTEHNRLIVKQFQFQAVQTVPILKSERKCSDFR